MASKYYALLTNRGATKLANAAALGTKLDITYMAVGDGGGVLPTPDSTQTALIRERRRAGLNLLTVDPLNASQIIAEQVIPENEGGFWIREIGLYDADKELIAVANCAETYKPLLQEGSGRTQTIRMILIISSTEAVTLKIDPSVVLATRKYVDDAIIEVRAYADDLMAKHLAAADPHTQYAPKASPTFTGTPRAPAPAAADNSLQIATTAFVRAAVSALVDSSPAALDTLKELATALGNDPNFATTMTNALALKAPIASPALTGTPTAPTAAQTVNSTQVATTAFVQAAITALTSTLNSAIALKAPFASPALTGTPTAPTAAQTVNSTQVATTAFVKAAIAGLVGSSPAALDTLNELAAALGNDPNFAASMTNALAGKQPLDETLSSLAGKDVAGILSYLGVKEAAKRDVGTGANQIPDMSAFQSGSNSSGVWVKFPNGFLIQRGGLANTSQITGIEVTFPTPFLNQPSVALNPTSAVPIIAAYTGVNQTRIAAVRTFGVDGSAQQNGLSWLAVGF